MSDELHHIRRIIEQSDGHLSFEMMERYIAGTLTYHEQHLVEKELLANPFLADAMEGLKASRSNIARSGVEDVNALIDQMADEEKVVKKIPYFKITSMAAAALVLIVGAVALLNTAGETQSESLAKTEEPPAEQHTPEKKSIDTKTYKWKEDLSNNAGEAAAAEATEEAVEEMEEIVEEEAELVQEDSEMVEEEPLDEKELVAVAPDSLSLNMKVTRSMVGTTATDVTEEKKSEEVVDIVMNEQEKIGNSRTEAQIANDMMAYNRLPALSYSTNKSRSPNYGKDSYNDKYMEEKDLSKKEKSKAGTSANFYDEAVAAFNGGNYKEAASKFDMVLSSDPSNSTALVYGGVSHLKQGNTNRAEGLLKDVAISEPLGEHASWYLSTAYLLEGKKRKATQILKELASSATYGVKAKSILEEL